MRRVPESGLREPKGTVPLSLDRVKIGIQLPEVERDVRWPEYLAMARAAEAAGFDSIWIGDHLLYDGRPSARRGRRGRCSPRSPRRRRAWSSGRSSLARASTRRACSRGWPRRSTRSAAGASASRSGSGWNGTEFRAFGIPFDRRVARFEEAFAILAPLLAGERVTASGTHYSADDAVLLPARRGGCRS